MKNMESKKTNKFETRWEFIFKFNNNIICQRYFDVRRYNEQSINSVEFKDAFSEITSNIVAGLKDRALDSLNNERNKYYTIPNYNETLNDDNFYFQVLVDGKVVMEEIMDATLYPNLIRTSVDLRPMVHSIIAKLQKVMSTKKLTLYPRVKTGYDKYYNAPEYNWLTANYSKYL